MSSDIKVGIVGTGIFARDAHLPSINSIEGITIDAAYNRTKSKAEDFAEHANIDKSRVFEKLEDLLADPSVDAVDALVPVSNNLSIIKQAIAANKPIAIEKPISSNLADAKEIVKVTKETDLPVLILENFVYHEGVAKLKELLPKIGKVVTFLYQSTGPYAVSKYHSTAWRLKPEHVGGYLSDGGVHQMAVLTEVLGEVESVSGRTTQLRDVSGDVDTLNALFNMKSGTFGTFTYASYFGATTKTTKFTIFGTQGSLIYDNSPGHEPFVVLHEGADAASAKDPETIKLVGEKFNGVDAEFANFAEAVKKGDKSLLKVTPEKAFHHFAVIVAAVESGAKGGELTKVEQP
ncbi:hypothetical protein TRVA0_035S01464 [Trichomonascus vanleenenianus]|uniref:uncharacterized protein n=1 Tax=Trichomonascus vanleenenianus TaxID=2268995 RepID=UPI003ECB8E35